MPGADLEALAGALGLPAPTVATPTRQTGARALLRIQDGCDEHCTFCATTLARGAHRSRARRRARRRSARAGRAPPRDRAHRHPHRHYGHGHRQLARRARRAAGARRARRALPPHVDRGDRGRRPAAPSCSSARRAASRRISTRRCSRARTACCGGWGATGTPPRDYAAAVERLAARAPVFGLGADVIAGFPGETRRRSRARRSRSSTRCRSRTLHVFPYSRAAGHGRGAARRARSRRAWPRERAAELREIAARQGGGASAGSRAAARRTSSSMRQGAAARGLTEDYLDVSLERRRAAAASRFRATLVARGGDAPGGRARPGRSLACTDVHRAAPDRLRRDVRLPDERERLRADARKARGARLRRRSTRPTARTSSCVNTCAIRDHAEQRVIGRLGELKRHMKPDSVMGVTGCMAQRLGPRAAREGAARVARRSGPTAIARCRRWSTARGAASARSRRRSTSRSTTRTSRRAASTR